jgi:hypothetical protein
MGKISEACHPGEVIPKFKGINVSNNSGQTGQLDGSHRGEVSHIRVGELLVEAGVVSSAEMTEAIQVSKRLGVPIGRVLTMSGWVPEPVLEAALQVQQLIRHDEVPLIAAINSLQRVHQMKISITEALAEEDLKPDLLHDPHKLAELLVDSNIVSAEQMEKAVQSSFEHGVPLGSTLVIQGFMSEAVLPSLERIQRQISEGKLSREDGLKEIQATFVLWVKADESLKQPLEIDEPKAPVRTDARDHREDHLKESKRVNAPQPANQAPQTTATSVAREPAQATTPEDNSNVRLVDLLKQSEIFSQTDVQRRYDSMLKDPVRSAKFFLELGLVDEEDLKNALRTHSLMQRGHLSRDEAALALRQLQSSDFERELGSEGSEKVRRYTDKRWRGHMGKVIGGALFGAFVAGITMGKRGK